ncbi:MAG: cysteine desulfurase NifS [Candidatus Schekmanbacteria bacterium GWA2_38_11]|uniref:cysteine desulfurase n=1 Tax=Candidatus Schekmanbacteria bacterium GWA2_38_11 TaxID=1817876 RepID=A0A1F7RG18_9BACT|nr:MAG: cysteine desulfurase NifS [Candidatus Schekmanbacteria bacterium GWA2_38_11]
MGKRIYMDNSASTRVDSRIVEEMLPYFTDYFGNASSLHSYGREVKDVMEKARAKLASYIGANPEEIIFTSGGTESNNLAIKGVAFANRKKGKHIIVSRIEHDCILNSCRWLKGQGFEITYLPVDKYGFINLNQLEDQIRRDTILVSIMHANNEIGTIEPVGEIGNICRAHGVYFHTDACQSFTKVQIDVRNQNIDLASINSHKIYGPKGVGALFIREGVEIEPWQHGGGHERGLRSSTENIPGIAGFVKAAELCHEEFEPEIKRLKYLRDKIISNVLTAVNEAYLNGHGNLRLPNSVNFGFYGFEGEAIRLLLELDAMSIAVSTGSACSSNQAENKPSHVLAAIGLNPVQARGALRVTLGRYNTEEEVDYFLDTLPKAFKKLRSISSMNINLGGQ